MAVSSSTKKVLVSVGVLVGVGALLVGIGHWRAQDLVAGDVGWHAEVGGSVDETVVVRDRIYTYQDDVLTIRDLASGKMIAEDRLDGTWARVGDGGNVAVLGIARIAMYDRDGNQEWTKELDDLHMPIAISPDGHLDAIRCSESDKCVLVHFDSSGTVTSRTPRRAVDLGSPAVIGTSTFDDGQLVQRVPTVPVDIDPKTHSAYQVRDGKRWGSPVDVMDEHTAAQVGDLLVGVSRKDGICTLAAVRSGVPEWTATTTCPDLGFPEVEVFANRIFLTNLSDGAYDVVTSDLGGRRATAFRVDRGTTSESTGNCWNRPRMG